MEAVQIEAFLWKRQGRGEDCWRGGKKRASFQGRVRQRKVGGGEQW
jgi:hypothetical protein